jgi:hypothetical protein
MRKTIFRCCDKCNGPRGFDRRPRPRVAALRKKYANDFSVLGGGFFIGSLVPHPTASDNLRYENCDQYKLVMMLRTEMLATGFSR